MTAAEAVAKIRATAARMVKAEKTVSLVRGTCLPARCPAVPPSAGILAALAALVAALLGDGR